jgi:hypothetical protein
VALADQVAGHSLGYINPALYKLAQSKGSHGIVPISQGGNTFTFCRAADLQSDSSCASSSDLVTVHGLRGQRLLQQRNRMGTVDAASFVPALARFAG